MFSLFMLKGGYGPLTSVFYFISILFVTVIQRKTNNMKYGLSAIRKPLLVKIQ